MVHVQDRPDDNRSNTGRTPDGYRALAPDQRWTTDGLGRVWRASSDRDSPSAPPPTTPSDTFVDHELRRAQGAPGLLGRRARGAGRRRRVPRRALRDAAHVRALLQLDGPGALDAHAPGGASRRGAGVTRAPRSSRSCAVSPPKSSSSCRPAARTCSPAAARPEKVDGGYRVTARKIFGSGSPAGSTSDDDGDLRRPEGRADGLALPGAARRARASRFSTTGARSACARPARTTSCWTTCSCPTPRSVPAGKPGVWGPAFHVICTIALSADLLRVRRRSPRARGISRCAKPRRRPRT